MAKKFYDIEEAATILGVTPGELNEMRARNEIRGFRDGTTWKFRPEEVEKVAADLKNKPASASDESIGIGDDPGKSEGGSVLLSERELGAAATTSSTIIGKSPANPAESDIKLADTPGEKEGSAVSDVKLAASSDILASGKPDAGSGLGSGLGLKFEELDSLDLELEDSAKLKAEETPKKPAAPAKPGDSSLLGDENLTLAADDGSKATSGSEIGGSALDLSGGDDDLVLGGSGSDVTTKPGDSGISLMDPSDSGLSLDEPMELTGSSIEGGSLVLGEDDMITLGGEADMSSATQLRTDDDFLLTPAIGAEGQDSESGSQVIALDGLEGLDDAATQVAGSPSTMRLLEEDISDANTMIGGPALAGAAPLPGMAAAAMLAPAVPEAPYSVWNLLSMFVCIAVLCLIGMMMFDMMRNIWSWNQAYPINSSLMDSLIDMFKK